VLDEVPGLDALLELVVVQKVVVDAVVLARPRAACRGRHREIELGDPLA
jgi:hypothetical protein